MGGTNAVSDFQTAIQIPEVTVFKSDDPKTQGRLKKDERVYRNVHQPFRLQKQYFDDQVLTMLAVYMINERINYEYRIAY